MSGPAAQAALASRQRRRLLDLLGAAAGPADAHELAAGTGLHLTTVRYHLDVLRRAGLVESRSRRRAGAGRPRTVYSPIRTPESGGYPTLTRMLAAQLADSPQQRVARAERAGLAWAAELTAGSAAGVQDAARVVTGIFADLGFDPELVGDATAGEIRLHACPFRTAARSDPDVVCSVHLGLLRGTLDGLGAPETAVRLLPFVEPDLCVATLSTVD
jgi:predicted ArsR family transcriptional regulator